VTAGEFSEGVQIFAACMTVHGAIVTGYTDTYFVEWPYGKKPSDGGLSEEDDCNIESGMYWIAPLHDRTE
jgi:hypothetical protein